MMDTALDDVSICQSEINPFVSTNRIGEPEEGIYKQAFIYLVWIKVKQNAPSKSTGKYLFSLHFNFQVYFSTDYQLAWIKSVIFVLLDSEHAHFWINVESAIAYNNHWPVKFFDVICSRSLDCFPGEKVY